MDNSKIDHASHEFAVDYMKKPAPEISRNYEPVRDGFIAGVEWAQQQSNAGNQPDLKTVYEGVMLSIGRLNDKIDKLGHRLEKVERSVITTATSHGCDERHECTIEAIQNVGDTLSNVLGLVEAIHGGKNEAPPEEKITVGVDHAELGADKTAVHFVHKPQSVGPSVLSLKKFHGAVSLKDMSDDLLMKCMKYFTVETYADEIVRRWLFNIGHEGQA